MSQYEVEKFQRDLQGQWYGRGAKRFASLEAAEKYFVRFAEAQATVLGPGTRIDLRKRAGRKIIARVGGRLEHNHEIRRSESGLPSFASGH